MSERRKDEKRPPPIEREHETYEGALGASGGKEDELRAKLSREQQEILRRQLGEREAARRPRRDPGDPERRAIREAADAEGEGERAREPRDAPGGLGDPGRDDDGR